MGPLLLPLSSGPPFTPLRAGRQLWLAPGPQLCIDVLSGQRSGLCWTRPGALRRTRKSQRPPLAMVRHLEPGQCHPNLLVTWCLICPLSCWGTSSRWASRPGCPHLSCCYCWTDAEPPAAQAAWGAGAAGRQLDGRTGLA